MCNCNNCGWQAAALERISCSCNEARLSNRGTSAAWRDYQAQRRSNGCGCRARTGCNGCCGCCGRDRCGCGRCGCR